MGKAFPAMPIHCEGHAKGQPADNNLARVKLSHMRAEGLKAALRDDGVTNAIECVGRGSEQGLGMCVRMTVMDPDAMRQHLVEIPKTEGMTIEEQKKALNDSLAKIL